MTTIHLSDGIIKDEILVVGLSHKKSKSSVTIESGDIALDTKKILATLADMGATGKADEVIKIPGTSTRLLIFTGLGEHKATFDDETLRRAAGAAARAPSRKFQRHLLASRKESKCSRSCCRGRAIGRVCL